MEKEDFNNPLHINDVVRLALNKNCISQKMIMDEFDCGRFQAKKFMHQLIAIGVIPAEKLSNTFSISYELYPVTVRKAELHYLNLDLYSDFEHGHLLNHKKECIAKHTNGTVTVDDNGDCFITLNNRKSQLEPIDKNPTRMILGILKTGDKVTNDCYSYLYNNRLVFGGTKPMFEVDENMLGWGVCVNTQNKDKGHFVDFLPSVESVIFDAPVLSLDYLFADNEISCAFIPAIPNGITSITGICLNKVGLKSIPDLPESILCAESAFCGCKNLVKIGKFPETMVNYDNMLLGCVSLSDAVISTIPYNYDKSKLFGQELSLMDCDDILDNDEPLDDWINKIKSQAQGIVREVII